MAGPPRRALLAFAVVPVVLAGSLSAGEPASAAAPNTTWLIRTDVTVGRVPHPWRLRLDATRYNFVATDTGSVGFAFHRQATTGNKPTQYQFWTAGGDQTVVSCDGALQVCTERTGTDMQAYGSVNLTFNASRAPTVKTVRCKANNKVLHQVTTRPGKLTGTVTLDNRYNDYWGVVANKVVTTHGPTHQWQPKLPANFPATVTKTVVYDNPCPNGGGNAPCGNGVQVEGASLSIGQDFVASRQLSGNSTGHFAFHAELTTGVETLSQRFGIIALPPSTFMSVPQSGPTGVLSKEVVHLGAMAPFLSGDVTFEATAGTISDPDPSCAYHVHRKGTVSGSPTIKFDGYDDVFVWYGYAGHSTIRRWHD